MLRSRLIPCLLLKNKSLVKTIKFDKFEYVGDPCNTVRIFNELEVDEVIIFDIDASKNKKSPNFDLIKNLANECFMPLSYGGGIDSIDHAKKLFDLGIEKISLNTSAIYQPNLVDKLAKVYGSQAIIGCIDIKKNMFGVKKVWSHAGGVNTKKNPIEWALELEDRGVGEILLTSVDNEGTWKGLDLDTINEISNSVYIPLIAHGGAGRFSHVKDAIYKSGASAVAIGNMVVYQKKNMGILINFPGKEKVNELKFFNG